MRRNLWTLAVLLAASLIATFFIVKPNRSPAEAGKPDTNGTARSPFQQLPIGRVVLFSSGVGYFQREGEVEGTSKIDLAFPAQEINDLLKSMVLQDLNGGHISAISYDSHDPVDKTLKSFAVNLSQNPSFGQILHQMRGEKVDVTLQPGNLNQPGNLSGSIVGVERKKQVVSGASQPNQPAGIVETEFLNLWCADGLHSCKLAEVQRIRFLNPVIENEFKRSLGVLAMSHDALKKSVSLTFTGEGKRKVKVGYVVENPIWKTSYRLVIGKDKPLLQGWAVVENPSDEDWTNVRMALISGRPISFQMDLYQPLYVPRPMVEPELFASLRPQTYSGGMGSGRGSGKGSGSVEGATVNDATPADDAAFRSIKKPEADRAVANGENKKRSEKLKTMDSDELGVDVRRSVASAASAAQLGDYFEYLIEDQVSLPRQKSALIPIVNKDIEASKVSIYNEATHAKFPLLGLKLKNTTALHLMQGPITVYEGNSYAGDAQIMDLQPKEDRLLSYAIDLGTEVAPVAKREPERLITVKINKGILQATHKLRESKTFQVKNRSEQDRTLLIEHPFRADFKLVSKEKPVETTRDVYRFEVKVAAGKTAGLEVTEELDQRRDLVLTNSDEPAIRAFLSNPVLTPKVKESLQQAIELKTKQAASQREIAQVNDQLKLITEDQTRLRANLKEMPATAKAYARYLEKFDKQEIDIEKLQERVQKLKDAEIQQRKEYETFLATLTVE